MFRNFIEPSFLFIIQSVFSIENHHQPIYVALGKFLGALITLGNKLCTYAIKQESKRVRFCCLVGPELQNNTRLLNEMRSYCLLACSILQAHVDTTVKAEAIQCLQKLYLFSPKSINLKELVPQLIVNYFFNYFFFC